MQIAKSKNLAKTRSRREIEPIDLQAPWGSIDVASKIDGTSPWSVKEKLRKEFMSQKAADEPLLTWKLSGTM